MGSKKLNMKTIVALLFITIIQSSLSIGVFGTGSAPQNSCRSDRDCPRLFSGPGRCLTSRGGWCSFLNNAGSLWLGDNGSCNYRKCASCLNDVDCSYNRRCSRGSCVRKDACYSDFDCYNGQTCAAGRCIKDRKRY